MFLVLLWQKRNEILNLEKTLGTETKTGSLHFHLRKKTDQSIKYSAPAYWRMGYLVIMVGYLSNNPDFASCLDI